MTRTLATAPGKIILFGEHAVVYGRPAIAAPVTQVRASAVVEDSKETGIRLIALDLNQECWLDEAKSGDPFAHAVRLFLREAKLSKPPNLTITVKSDIPIASGLGSGAAMAAAVIRALANHLGLSRLASNAAVSAISYNVEKLLHGTPSGIDNTVVAYEQPVYFVRRQPENYIETLGVRKPIFFLVADSGIASSTKEVVGDVRQRWLEDKGHYEEIFDGCGQIAVAAKDSVEAGDIRKIGRLMSENHELLVRMTVSSDELDALVESAMVAGAIGAKMSGGGRGGNVIALVDPSQEAVVREALLLSGARMILSSSLD